jgi:hypothetical protein
MVGRGTEMREGRLSWPHPGQETLFGKPERGRDTAMDGKRNIRILAFVYGGYIMRYIYLIVVIPFYGRVLGVTEYGRVLAAMSVMNVIWMLVSYGFTFVGIRDVSRAHSKGEHNAIFSLHLSARLLTALLGGLVGVSATFFSPVLSGRPVIGILATALGIVSGLNLGWLFQGRHRFRTPITLEVVGFALSLMLIFSFVHRFRLGGGKPATRWRLLNRHRVLLDGGGHRLASDQRTGHQIVGAWLDHALLLLHRLSRIDGVFDLSAHTVVNSFASRVLRCR